MRIDTPPAEIPNWPASRGNYELVLLRLKAQIVTPPAENRSSIILQISHSVQTAAAKTDQGTPARDKADVPWFLLMGTGEEAVVQYHRSQLPGD